MKKNLISVAILIGLLILLGLVNMFNPDARTPQATPSPVPTETPLANDLVLHSWKWKQTENGEGHIILPATSSKPFILNFGTDGRFSLATDCNSHAGSYVVDGDSIRFGAMISTKMFCEGSYESGFVNLLASSTTYHLGDDGMLSIVVGQGVAQIVFNKMTITSFEECAAAGNPIMESYPEQCRAPDGTLFVRNIGTTTLPTTVPLPY